jgi:hypothetical protein
MQCRIGFSILARAGNQQCLVLYIDRTGSGQPPHISVQKYVVLECLRVLQNIGYNIPTYSSMRIGALNVGVHHDIGRYCAQLAENNINDVVSLIIYIQINCYIYIYMHGSNNYIFLNTCRFSRMA